jgi:hypothetical protein
MRSLAETITICLTDSSAVERIPFITDGKSVMSADRRLLRQSALEENDLIDLPQANCMQLPNPYWML